MDHPQNPQRPDLRALFLAFAAVGLSGFGGVLPFARRMLVEQRGWLSAEEFNAQLGLCQFLPGPNVVNLSIVVGKRFHGWRGAVVAPLGMLLAPMLIVLLLGMAYDRWGQLPLAQDMLRGIAAAGCALLFAMAWRMGAALRDKALFLPFTVLTVAAIAWLRWPLPAVMLGGLAAAGAVAWWRLGRS